MQSAYERTSKSKSTEFTTLNGELPTAGSTTDLFTYNHKDNVDETGFLYTPYPITDELYS